MNINFFATYKCNSRCVNCSIWKGESVPAGRTELSSKVLEKLFDSPTGRQAPAVGIAGGEPTIAPFFTKLLDSVPAGKQVIVTTNALNSKKLLDCLHQSRSLERFLVQVSIDGIKDVNDELRGVQGAFDKAVHLLETLNALGVKTLVSFTINRKNIGQLESVYRLARSFDAGFSTRMAYCGGAYDNQDNAAYFNYTPDDLAELDSALSAVIASEARKENHDPAQLVFWDRITDCHRHPEKQRQVPCRALDTDIVIDLYGDVFANCPALMDTPLGNVTKMPLDEILKSGAARQMRNNIESFACGGCWNDCQVVTNIRLSKNFLAHHYNRIILKTLGKVPDKIDFSRPGPSFLLSGWYALEKGDSFNFRWTDRSFAVPVPPGTRAIDIFAAVPWLGTERPENIRSGTDGREVELVLESQGREVARAIITSPDWQEIRILLDSIPDKTIVGTFSLNRCLKPGDKKDSSDERTLGMAVSRIGFVDKPVKTP